MKMHTDLIQGSVEWHEMKWGKVGGSSSKGLFVPSDTLLYEVLSECTEPFQLEPDAFVNADMQRGIDLEPIGRAKVGSFAKVEFINVGWIESDFSPMFGISPDGITADGKVSCEVKCPARKKHISTVLCKEIPSDHIHQCLHYFTINKALEKHFFGSFRPECDYPLWIKQLTRETPIDLGTKAKPNIKAIGEWVEIAIFNAKELEKNIQIAIAQLEKI